MFREVNERIREVNETFAVDDRRASIDVFCECGQTDCLRRVELPPAIYEQVRDGEGYFLVTPGHEDGELVVAEGASYRIVLLHGAGERSQAEPPVRRRPALLQEAS
ncbi:hypothetical protein BH18ACT12_BH18ACT12_19970 [soil metagenome]